MSQHKHDVHDAGTARTGATMAAAAKPKSLASGAQGTESFHRYRPKTNLATPVHSKRWMAGLHLLLLLLPTIPAANACSSTCFTWGEVSQPAGGAAWCHWWWCIAVAPIHAAAAAAGCWVGTFPSSGRKPCRCRSSTSLLLLLLLLDLLLCWHVLQQLHRL
jgi:hypothetical protein